MARSFDFFLTSLLWAKLDAVAPLAACKQDRDHARICDNGDNKCLCGNDQCRSVQHVCVTGQSGEQIMHHLNSTDTRLGDGDVGSSGKFCLHGVASVYGEPIPGRVAQQCDRRQYCKPSNKDNKLCVSLQPCDMNSMCDPALPCSCGGWQLCSKLGTGCKSERGKDVLVDPVNALSAGEVTSVTLFPGVSLVKREYCIDESEKHFVQCVVGNVCAPTRHGDICFAPRACSVKMHTCSVSTACKCGSSLCSRGHQICDNHNVVNIRGKTLDHGGIANETVMFCINDDTISKCKTGYTCERNGNCKQPAACKLSSSLTCSPALPCMCGDAICNRPSQFCSGSNKDDPKPTMIELTGKNTLGTGYAASTSQMYCVQGGFVDGILKSGLYVASCKPDQRCNPNGLNAIPRLQMCLDAKAIVGHGPVSETKICIGEKMAGVPMRCKKGKYCDLHNDVSSCVKDPTACEVDPPLKKADCKSRNACVWNDICEKQTCENSRSTLESRCPSNQEYVTDIKQLKRACTGNNTAAPCTVYACCVDAPTKDIAGGVPTESIAKEADEPDKKPAGLDTVAISLICLFVALFFSIIAGFVWNIVFRETDTIGGAGSEHSMQEKVVVQERRQEEKKRVKSRRPGFNEIGSFGEQDLSNQNAVLSRTLASKPSTSVHKANSPETKSKAMPNIRARSRRQGEGRTPGSSGQATSRRKPWNGKHNADDRAQGSRTKNRRQKDPRSSRS